MLGGENLIDIGYAQFQREILVYVGIYLGYFPKITQLFPLNLPFFGINFGTLQCSTSRT